MVGNNKAAKSRLGLVDLDGFEPSTSSMPFKKYQSLADNPRQNKGLSRRRFGRQWTPRGDFWGVWKVPRPEVSVAPERCCVGAPPMGI